MNSYSHYHLQLRPPSWLTRKAWDLLALNSYSGFKFRLRAYSIVPPNAPIFQYASAGNISGLLGLFDQGLGSPFDRNDRGETLLHVTLPLVLYRFLVPLTRSQAALASRDVAVVSRLTDWGLDLAEIFNPATQITSWMHLLWKSHDYSFEKLRALHEFARSKDAYDEYADAWFMNPWSLEEQSCTELARVAIVCCLSANSEAMQLMLPHLRPGQYQLAAKERLSFFCFTMNDLDADSLRITLQQNGQLQPETIQQLDQDRFPLIKLMAWRYKTELNLNASMSARRQKWRKLSRDIVRVTTLLHCEVKPHRAYLRGVSCDNFPYGTPLLSVISGPFVAIALPCTFARWRRISERALLHWLEDLESCGIDLTIYGEKEARIFSENVELRSLCYGVNIDRCCGAIWRLESFTYGPNARNWESSWDLGVEAFVGEFWDVVENPSLNMTGSWVD